MTRRLAAALACALTVSACGMAVGLRPVEEGTGVQALGAETTGDTVPTTIATQVAGVVVTSTIAERVDTTTTTADLETTSTTTPPAETTTTGEPETTTTTVEETTTTVVETTTTSEDGPPTTIVEIPDFDDIGSVFDEDGAFVTHNCAGGDVTINGDAGTFTLEGDCGSLLVKGSFNTVFVDSVQAIDLTGTLNAVVHGPGSPTVNDWDGENIITGG